METRSTHIIIIQMYMHVHVHVYMHFGNIVLTEHIGLYVGILLAKNIHVCVQARCL